MKNKRVNFKKSAGFILVLLVLSASLLGCFNVERVDSPAIREEIKSRTVKQITSQQFTAITQLWGKDFASSIQKEMERYLAATKVNPAEICGIRGLYKTDSVKKIYRLQVKLLTRKDLSNKALSPKEIQVLDAFAYNAENKLPPSENVQKLNDSLMLFSLQLPYNSAICKACLQGDPTNLAVLNVIIPKKTIVRNITVKELKKIK